MLWTGGVGQSPAIGIIIIMYVVQEEGYQLHDSVGMDQPVIPYRILYYDVWPSIYGHKQTCNAIYTY